MSEVSFFCPKCKKPTLSVDKGEAVEKYASNPQAQAFVKQKMAESPKMKKYRFWLCDTQGCPNYEVYYQTDLNGKYITEIRYPSMNKEK